MGITIDQVQIEQVLTMLQHQETHRQVAEIMGLCPDLTEDQVLLAIGYLT